MPEGVKAGTAYVDVDADLAKLKKTIDQGVPKAVDAAAAKASKGSPSRWAGLGDGLKKGIAGSLGQLSGLQIGGGVAALGVGLEALAGPAERAKKQLEATFTAAGQNIEEYKGQISSTENRMENFAHTNADTDTALRVLTTALGSPKKALADMSLVADIAAAKHISLADAAALDVKAHAGSTKVFKQFGITVLKAGDPVKIIAKATIASTAAHTKYAAAVAKVQRLEALDHLKKKLTAQDWFKLRDAQNAAHSAHGVYLASLERVRKAHELAKHAGDSLKNGLAELAKKLHGQAAASVDSFSGKLDVWKTKIQDVAAKWGEKLGPILTTAGPLIAGVGGILSSGLIPALGATEVAEDGVAVSTDSMLGPVLLIVAGIALLVAGVIYAYTHWTAFRNVVDGVGRFLRDTVWPIIQTVFHDIGHVVMWLWTNVVQPAIAGIKLGFNLFWAALKLYWDTIGHPIFTAVETVVKWLWHNVIQPAIAGLKNDFRIMWDVVKWAWETIGHPVFHAIGVVIQWLVNHGAPLFEAFGKAISVVWDHVLRPPLQKLADLLGHIKDLNGAITGKSGGILGAIIHGGVSSIPVVGPLAGLFGAEGGVFDRPTPKIIGEAGREVLIPLTNPRRAAELMAQTGLSGGGTTNNTFIMQQGMTPDQILAAQRREDRLAYAG